MQTTKLDKSRAKVLLEDSCVFLEPEDGLHSWGVAETHSDKVGEVGGSLTSESQGGNLDFILISVKPLEHFNQ